MLKNIDRKYLLFGGIIIGVVVIFVIILLVISATKGGKVGYKDIETRMYRAAVQYYEKHEKDLPKNDGATISISIDKLVKSGNLTSLEESLDEGVSCKGEVTVTNNNQNYIYLPYLDCGKAYKTEKLVNKIVDSDVLNEVEEGLYEVEDGYVYKGENVNNYLEFAGKNWRIIKINEDGTIRVILAERLEQMAWDDRYNVDKKFNAGINNYDVSRIKEKLQEIYEDSEMFNDTERSMIVTQNLCVSHRSENSEINDGSIECASTFDGQQLGLLQLNEYLIPSLDDNCTKPSDRSCINYNYLATFDRSYWTITGDSETSYMVYHIDGYAELRRANSVSGVNPVINLTKNLIYDSGKGTIDEPYKIKKYPK